MNLKMNLSLVAGGVSLMASAACPHVSNVRFAQDAGRVVTIQYDLAGADAVITADVLTNGTSIGVVNFTNMTGAVNRRVSMGTDLTIQWKPWESWPDRKLEPNTVSVRVTAWNVNDPPDYHVTDLDSGAISYYVSPEAFPGGFWDRRYRTSKLVMKKISAAMKPFVMGAKADELGDLFRQKQHMAMLTNDYYIGVFEFTQAQWMKVYGTKSVRRTSTVSNDAFTFDNTVDADLKPVNKVCVSNLRGYTNGSAMPTTQGVDDWSFLGKLRTLVGQPLVGAFGFDLPSEMEWEFACRAGSEESRFCADLNAVSRNRDNGGMDGEGFWSCDVAADRGTARVGSYAPNAYGLYDMYGNVNEICLDHYAALTDGRAVTDPLVTTGEGCVARGGNAESGDLKWLTSSMRMGPSISSMTNPNRGDLYGARLSLAIPAE